MKLGPLVVAVALTGCIEADLVECPNGTVCAADRVCDTIHLTCVDPDQVSACDGAVERAACEWSDGAGKCFDGVCLIPGCGNRVVESEFGEACDDGGVASLDGCSADCTSTEICGNGVVDLLQGEVCDDANLRSHDGCDSKCKAEVPTIVVTGVGIPFGEPGHGVFDETRGRFVHVGDGLTWEYDGQRWTIIATTGVPSADWFVLVYDSDRQRVAMVGAKASVPGIKPIDLYLEWDGAAWSQRATTGLAQATTGIAAYDRANHRVVVYAGSLMWQLSSTAVWSELVVPPTIEDEEACTNAVTLGGQSIVYDVARDKIVLVLGGFITEVPLPADPIIVPTVSWELTGSTWECFPSPLSGGNLGAPQLIHANAKVVAIGGNQITVRLSGNVDTTLSTDIHTWNATTHQWDVVMTPAPTIAPIDLPNITNHLEIGFDTVSQKLFAFGGLGDDDLFVLDNTGFAVQEHLEPHVRGNVLTAYDTSLGQLVLLHGDAVAETWTWNDQWARQTPTASPPLLPGATMLYDPSRQGVVFLDQDLKTYKFDGTTWAQLGGAGVVFPLAMTFDPKRGRLIAAAADGLVALTADNSTWEPIGPPPPQTTRSMGFDARNDVVVAVGTVDGGVFTFDGVSWQPTLTPGDASYAIVSDQRRGSVDFVSPIGTLWERVGDNWTEYPALPVAINGPPHYDPVRGRLVVFGTVGRSRVMVTRQYVGTVPDETCMSDFDADGDGKLGCDDDDCFWKCTPACPPFTTCTP